MVPSPNLPDHLTYNTSVSPTNIIYSNPSPSPAGNTSFFNELLLGTTSLIGQNIITGTGNEIGTGNIMTINNNLDNMNQLDQAANAQNPLDNNSYNMNISSLLDLDNQQPTSVNGFSSLLDYFDIDGKGAQQSASNLVPKSKADNNADEENMTDSFNKITLK